MGLSNPQNWAEKVGSICKLLSCLQQCRGLNVCHWHLDCHGLKDTSLDLERDGDIVDFQTGGPTMSPLLLIYMYWKSNGFYQGKPFCPASGPPQVDIWSYPYDIIGSNTGLMWVCGG